MVPMFVNKVAVDPQGHALVFLTDEENRRLLPIWIGLFEAQAIVAEMRETRFPRPMTHDLLRSVIEATGHTVHQIRITQLQDKTFYAVLDLEGDAGPLEIDARPSDAIALALRTSAPILVAEEVLAEAELPTDRVEEEEMETFRKLMSTLSPADQMPDLAGPLSPDSANTESGPRSEETSEAEED
jgi:uncharacterized protein